MYGISLILVFMLAFSTTSAANFQRAARAYLHAVVEFNAEQLPAYGLYLQTYARDNPAVTGEVANADVTMPGWFLPASTLRNYVAAGAAYVYLVPDNAAQGFAIARSIRSGPGGELVRCGIAVAGMLQYPGSSAPSTIALPADIPDGAVVMVM